MTKSLSVAAVALLFASGAVGQPPAPGVPHPDPWPKSATAGGTTYTLYQPQPDSWDYALLRAHAAISVRSEEAKEPVFGVVELTAKTVVDRLARTVHFSDIKVPKATFPSAPARAAGYREAIQSILSKGPAPVPLDRLEAALKILGAEKNARAVPVDNAPPAFVFAKSPTLLLVLDGKPVWTPVPRSNLTRVLNTRALIVSDGLGDVYIRLLDGWLTAPSLNGDQALSFGGPWSVATYEPTGASEAAQLLARQNLVDLMPGPRDEATGQGQSLGASPPNIVVATKPTELIVTQGEPAWAPIDGTKLLYVENTTANVFRNRGDQQTYVLATGRWFRSPGFGGPWVYVPGRSLPPDFARIPDTSPKENVKASIPGTAQAKEALIANGIPQMATVDRKTVRFAPEIKGAPKLRPIEGTPLSYVANSPAPVIKAGEGSWYACQSGVWFVAPAVTGPWAVAASVPAVIYSIPPSSPLFYVTFVRLYGATPDTVTVGYTPGYLGTAVAPDDVVVYGTGYSYPPYLDSSVWYPAPVTYGYDANVTYTPWTGWAAGFGFGYAACADEEADDCAVTWGVAPYWGAMPYAYRGAAGAAAAAAAWGPRSWAVASGNVYHQYDAGGGVSHSAPGFNAWNGNAWSRRVGTSYNSVTGRASAGQQAPVTNAYAGGAPAAGRGETGGPGGSGNGPITLPQPGGDAYADRDGTVVRHSGSGWQESRGGGGWNDVSDRARAASYSSREAASRMGGERSAAASSWGAGGGGGGGGAGFGGFHGGGGGRR